MSEKRTIESFLKELQPEHYNRLRGQLNDEMLSAEEETHAGALCGCAIWSELTEGKEYWETVYNSLCIGSYQFPPQPVKEETQGEQDKMIAEFMGVFGLSFKSKKWTDEIEIIKSKFTLQRNSKKEDSYFDLERKYPTL